MGGSVTKVLQGLYVGRLDNVTDEKELIADCISHILVIQEFKFEIEKSAGRHYLQLLISDHDDHSLLRCLSEANDFIHSGRMNSGNVLVCSDSGMSANVAVVVAYLMSVYLLDRHSALAVVRALKPGAQPVLSLQTQLEGFDTDFSPNCNQSNSPGSVPLCTAHSEHKRLIEKFGPWPCLEEDMQSLQLAINSVDSQSHPLCLGEFDTSLKRPVEDYVELEHTPSAMHLGRDICESFQCAVRLTPPATPPSTPNSPNIGRTLCDLAGVPVNVEQVASLNETTIHTGADDESNNTTLIPAGLSELELFPLDPSVVDPDNHPLEPFPNQQLSPTWVVHNGRSVHVDKSGLDAEEVGIELKAENEDDVPGAIPMPLLSTRAAIAHSQRSGLAASYSVRLPSERRLNRVPVAHTFAPLGLFQPH
ncbi:Dual specificity protein phosphatase 15 [Paragonimus heterotremus]|uniref:Dual specificity protein phosphatase 15 n=1 Tax=Paragonimus heterotremus TaxID=100268 RepID=A0A8J4WFN2_9TREM|nr:Dual specificity protein phosphatase 15 [Paragonimus heterotremus]